MGAGFPAVCAFVSNMLDALVPEAATWGSTMSIFQRVARSGAYPAHQISCAGGIQLCHGKRRAWHTAADLIHVGGAYPYRRVVCWLTFYMACPVGLGNTTGMKPKSNASRRILFPS